jgi:lipopolysaccharide export LptBFGC system permease protein LptF
MIVITRYISKKFLLAFLSISIFLTLLFNLIEFFEKFIYFSHVKLILIFKFISLNFIPSFFENFPVAIWLSSCLLLREFFLQGEIDTLALLNISYKKLILYVFYISLGIMLFSLINREIYVEDLGYKTEKFKIEKLKQTPTHKLISTWFLLDKHTLCYFSFFDFNSSKGQNLSIIYLDKNFLINKILTAPSFFANPKNKTLNIPLLLEDNLITGAYLQICNTSLSLEPFFSQIILQREPQSLLNSIKIWLFNKNTLPENLQDEILFNLFKKIIFYFHIILYPLFTLLLFYFFYNTEYLKWGVLFSPYIGLTLINFITDYLHTCELPVYIIFIPYILLFLIILILYRKYM